VLRLDDSISASSAMTVKAAQWAQPKIVIYFNMIRLLQSTPNDVDRQTSRIHSHTRNQHNKEKKKETMN